MPHAPTIDAGQTVQPELTRGSGLVSLCNKKGGYYRSTENKWKGAVQTYNLARRRRPEVKPWRRSGICRKSANPDLRNPERQFLLHWVFQGRRSQFTKIAAQSLNERHLDAVSQTKVRTITGQVASGTSGRIAGGGNVGREKSESAYVNSGSQKVCVQKCRQYFWSFSFFSHAVSSLATEKFTVLGQNGLGKTISISLSQSLRLFRSSKILSLGQWLVAWPPSAWLQWPFCKA